MNAAPAAPPPARMSGGEIDKPRKDAYDRLARLIKAEDDVHRLLALDHIEGKWIYLIETPFASFPQFVIGTTDDDNAAPAVLFKCSAEWSAIEEWQHVQLSSAGSSLACSRP